MVRRRAASGSRSAPSSAATASSLRENSPSWLGAIESGRQVESRAADLEVKCGPPPDHLIEDICEQRGVSRLLGEVPVFDFLFGTDWTPQFQPASFGAKSATLTFWDAPTDGNRYTDLLDSSGAPITQLAFVGQAHLDP